MEKPCYAVSFMLTVTNKPLLPSVIMLNVVMLSAVAPLENPSLAKPISKWLMHPYRIFGGKIMVIRF
jgi:hypothetical protein